jgi:hypothetical protein
LYEKLYCARGDKENRIKEQQMDLFADRTSTRWMASSQLRLWFSAFAHLLMSAVETSSSKREKLASQASPTYRETAFRHAKFVSSEVWIKLLSFVMCHSHVMNRYVILRLVKGIAKFS